MEYTIAGHILRTTGRCDDLVRCGLHGFAPFATDTGANALSPAILLPEEPLSESEFSDRRETDRFQLGNADTVCRLDRHRNGYLFSMERSGEAPVRFAIPDGDNRIKSDIARNGIPDPSLLRFGLWMAFGVYHLAHRTIAIHASSIVHEGRAVLFLGESGTGKSTHARLWCQRIAGTRLLNDDSPIVRLRNDRIEIYGSPWSGKTPCYRPLHYPAAAFVRIVRATRNRISRLSGIEAIGALLPSVPPSFLQEQRLQDLVYRIVSDLITEIPVYRLECLPDAEAAELAHRTLYPESARRPDPKGTKFSHLFINQNPNL